LDRNLETVDSFYNKKYADSNRRLRLLHDRYGNTKEALDALDRDELEDLLGALLELRAQLRKLQWYGEVNRRGFIKITKKLDKQIPGAVAQQSYLVTKVDTKAFAANGQLQKDMDDVNTWLSTLGDIHISDDASSAKSASSTRIVSSRAILSLPPGLLNTVDQAIRSDDASILSELLLEANSDTENGDVSRHAFEKLLVNLLQRCITCRAKRCIEKILPQLTTLEDDEDIDHRNAIHRLVMSIGRAHTNEQKSIPEVSLDDGRSKVHKFIIPAELPIRAPLGRSKTEPEKVPHLSTEEASLQLLDFLLEKLSPRQRQAISALDGYGRMPLHYAAEFGLVAVCQTLIKHMRSWNQFDVSEGIESAGWQDLEGLSPLHLSVINDHIFTSRTLLEAEMKEPELDDGLRPRRKDPNSGDVLQLAVRADNLEIVKLLVRSGFDVNYINSEGEVALHIAARFGYEECAKVLLDRTYGQDPQLDVPEHTFAWTPFFVACVDGQLPIVKLLLEAGADPDRVDSSGWRAQEHAALRGHLDVAGFISTASPATATDTPPDPSPTAHSLEDRKSKGVSEAIAKRQLRPVKTFGHRYLVNETMVLVSLGTMDPRKQVDPVQLDVIPLANAHSTQLDTALSVVVSATGAMGESVVFDLPPQENIATDPVTFLTADASKVKLLFDIVPTYAGSNDKIVGRGVAILSTIKPNIGSKRMNLQGDMSVPILAANTLEVIGSITFNFLVITPFSHPNMTISEDRTYWKTVASTMVIGHRGISIPLTGSRNSPDCLEGLGKNMVARKSLQLGENTIQVR
jgi:glycerophosphodiester phosphodiesterase